MDEKRNARPGEATPERAMMNKGSKTTSSICNSNTDLHRTQEPIEAILRRGEENKLRTSFLTAITGMNKRQLQTEITREREAGVPILSTCRGEGGYFLPAEGEQGQRETEACLRTLRARAIRTLKAVQAIQEAAQSLEGQLTMDDLEGGNHNG